MKPIALKPIALKSIIRKMTKLPLMSTITALTLGLASSLSFNSIAQPAYYSAAPQTPDIYVMMFRADWCAPCKVVEPALGQALRHLKDPRVEYVHLDTTGGHGDANAHSVFDRGLVAQYNMWLGVTGFAAIVDGDTKRTLGCVNMTYDAQTMAKHIRNLQSLAQANQASFDLTCPAPNRPT